MVRSEDPPVAAPDLQLDDDMAFQRRNWLVERIAWGTMLLLVTAALVGVFSAGPISTRHVSDTDHLLTIRYERFARVGTTSELAVDVAGAATTTGRFEILLSLDLVERAAIERISPEPIRSRGGPRALALSFEALEPGRPATIHVDLRPRRAGWLRGSVGLAAGPAVPLPMLLYP